MDTGWIQVFVLVLTECVAPAGKNICQEQELRYEFLDRGECEAVLEQLLVLKDSSENIIVNDEKSACLPTAQKQQVYRSLDDANNALSDTEGWGQIPVGSRKRRSILRRNPIWSGLPAFRIVTKWMASRRAKSVRLSLKALPRKKQKSGDKITNAGTAPFVVTSGLSFS